MAERETSFIQSIIKSSFEDHASTGSSILGISQRLGLTKDDEQLAQVYLTRQLLRTSLYEDYSILQEPATELMSRIPLLSLMTQFIRWSNQIKRKILIESESETQKYIELHYQTSQQRRRAQTIELAINDLVERAISQKPHRTLSYPILSIETGWTAESLKRWQNRWHQVLAEDNQL